MKNENGQNVPPATVSSADPIKPDRLLGEGLPTGDEQAARKRAVNKAKAAKG